MASQSIFPYGESVTCPVEQQCQLLRVHEGWHPKIVSQTPAEGIGHRPNSLGREEIKVGDVIGFTPGADH